MTYEGFLLLFLLLPLGILVVHLRKRLLDRRYLIVVGILTLVALMYMAPWDHFAAIWGLWSWTNNRTWGLRWWAIPPEEYLFCVLEALLAITLTFAVLTRKDAQSNLSFSTSSDSVSLSDTSVSKGDERANQEPES